MKNRLFIILAILLAFSTLFIYCAGSRGDGQGESIQVIGKVILLPDSTGVSGATIRTEPMSSFVETFSDGSFKMADGLMEGRYAFIAQYNGIEGTSYIDLQSTNDNFVIIMLGKVYDMKDWVARNKALGGSGTGDPIQTWP